MRIIIIFTKTNDTIDALNSVKSIINHNTFLMSLQNGLGNFEKLWDFGIYLVPFFLSKLSSAIITK